MTSQIGKPIITKHISPYPKKYKKSDNGIWPVNRI